MTLLDTIIANSLEFSTLGVNLYCTTTSWEALPDDARGTTICSAVTSILGSIEVPDDLLAVRNAQAYVESMSDEQLVTLEQLLEQKELDFEISENSAQKEEGPKTYKKK